MGASWHALRTDPAARLASRQSARATRPHERQAGSSPSAPLVRRRGRHDGMAGKSLAPGKTGGREAVVAGGTAGHRRKVIRGAAPWRAVRAGELSRSGRRLSAAPVRSADGIVASPAPGANAAHVAQGAGDLAAAQSERGRAPLS